MIVEQFYEEKKNCEMIEFHFLMEHKKRQKHRTHINMYMCATELFEKNKYKYET